VQGYRGAVVLYGFRSSIGELVSWNNTGIQGYSSSKGLHECRCNTGYNGVMVYRSSTGRFNGYMRSTGVQVTVVVEE